MERRLPHLSTLGKRCGPPAVTRLPVAALRPFVALVWASGAPGAQYPAGAAVRREYMLPSGATHLAIRLSEQPLWISDANSATPQRFEGAMVSGARKRFYVRDSSTLSCSVGAVLKPGAAQALLGVCAHELAGAHTALAAAWGGRCDELRERMLLAHSGEQRLGLLEAALLARLPHACPVLSGVRAAIAQMPALSRIRDAVQLSGLSHRQFIVRFREAVGLDPKGYLRTLRLQATARALRSHTAPLWEIALDNGYSDQAHMTREFTEMAGVTPDRYRSAPDATWLHLPAGATSRGA